AAADGAQGAGRPRQVGAAAGARPLRAVAADRTAEDRVRHPPGGVAARAAARLGGGAARRAAAEEGRVLRPRADPHQVAGAPRRGAELALLPVERAHVPGLARALGRVSGVAPLVFV